MPENMRQSVTTLNDKLQVLAQQWGERYGVAGAIVLQKTGTLTLKRRDKSWSFWVQRTHESKPIALTSAPVEERLDVIHALTDLRVELARSCNRRMLDLDDAHDILDQLLLQGDD